MTPLRLGLIGCGGIARGAHLPAIAGLGETVRLVATADLSLASAQQAASKFGADAYDDYRSVVARADVDAVIVATPEAAHAEQVTAAAASGKHVLCEKPMARSLDEADAMIAACAKAGVRLMVGHSRRFTSRYLEIDRLLRSGEIGDVRLVRENERRIRGFGGGGKAMWTPQHWTGNPKHNIGVALLAGIHEVDILRWFARSEPVSIYAEQGVQTEGNVGVPDFLSFTVRFANGAIGSSEISRMPPASYPAFHQLELYGEKGAIRAKDHDCIAMLRYGETGAHFDGNQEPLLHGGPTYLRQLGAFVAMIREGRDPPVTPRDARMSLAMALAAVESAHSGRIVTLEPVAA